MWYLNDNSSEKALESQREELARLKELEEAKMMEAL